MNSMMRYYLCLALATLLFGFVQFSHAKEIHCRENPPRPLGKYRLSLKIGTNDIAELKAESAQGVTHLDSLKCAWLVPSVFYRDLRDTVIGNCGHERDFGNGFEITVFLKKGENTLLAEVSRKDEAGNPFYFWKMSCDEI